MEKISHEELKRVVHYDPKTGLFTWKIKLNRNMVVGSVAGWTEPDRYTNVGIYGISYLAHRLAWFYVYGQFPDGFQIDHINRIKTDNRIENLRLATNAQNHQNIHRVNRTNKHQVKGVTKNGNRWRASVICNGKQHIAGYFDSKEEASAAYEIKAKELHGEFFVRGSYE